MYHALVDFHGYTYTSVQGANLFSTHVFPCSELISNYYYTLVVPLALN